MLSAPASSYRASKAGLSNYLAGLALALRPMGASVTAVRFGFVDTKMAKGDVQPFMMSVDRALDHLERCIRTGRRGLRRRVSPFASSRSARS